VKGLHSRERLPSFPLFPHPATAAFNRSNQLLQLATFSTPVGPLPSVAWRTTAFAILPLCDAPSRRSDNCRPAWRCGGGRRTRQRRVNRHCGTGLTQTSLARARSQSPADRARLPQLFELTDFADWSAMWVRERRRQEIHATVVRQSGV
jgi:hypothetical protein